VLDGSHTWGGLHGDDLAFRRGAVADTLGSLPPELRGRVAEAERVVELAPGDVSFHGCLTFHGSRDNRSAATRKTLAVRLMDGECRLVPERLPSSELRALFTTDGDGRLVGPSFPVLWERAG
jgi:ectoine hydroxylase-related dioxygenase (phytanoyl-CoA dioxygenase family)